MCDSEAMNGRLRMFYGGHPSRLQRNIRLQETRVFCHYSFGLPFFICGRFSWLCHYGDTLIPTLLLTYQLRKYEPILQERLPSKDTGIELAFATAMIRLASLLDTKSTITGVLLGAD